MKELIQNLYRIWFKEDLIKTVETTVTVKEVVDKQPEKTPGDRLFEIAKPYYQVDPTPDDKQPDEVACVANVTTIIRKIFPDFQYQTYTPTFLSQIQKDWRFRLTTEFKKGTIIISVTNTGNGSIMGHTGICGEGGKILSNDSDTGLMLYRYDNLSWIERYSRQGKLKLYLFELIK